METTRKQTYAGLAFAVIVIGVVAFMGLLGFGQSAVLTASTTATGCQQSASSAFNPDTATVYYVTSTRAVLCVTYEFGGTGTTSFFTTVQPWYQMGSQVAETQCSTATCPNVTASVSSAHHGANAEVLVTYTITSQPGLTGLFIVFHAGCSPLYLAFGSIPSSVYLTAWTCGPSSAITGGLRSGNWSVTGFTGINSLSVPWN
jgi:hypothetical protein